jgi:hypothetical protein
MTTNTKPECETSACNYDSAKRTRFFHGMLLTDEHLRAEQEYHRNALKRITRYLWGSGIVCGLEVTTNGLCITVSPGVAIDCCGNLIEVCKCVTIDLSKECKEKFGSGCEPNKADATIDKYLVLRYAEKGADPEPNLISDDECKGAGETKCEHSSVREGYCIELWDECPCGKGKEEFDQKVEQTRELIVKVLEGQYTQSGQERKISVEEPCTDLCVDCKCLKSAVGLGKLHIDCTTKTAELNSEVCRKMIPRPAPDNVPPLLIGSREARERLETVERTPMVNYVLGRMEREQRVEQLAELFVRNREQLKRVEELQGHLAKSDKTIKQLTARLEKLEKKVGP